MASGYANARQKERERMRRLEEKERANEQKVELWFNKYDATNTGKFNKDEMRSLLTEVKREALSDPSAVVREELLDKIVTRYDLSGDGQIERAQLLIAVKKYRALLLHEERLQNLFLEHDVDQSGVLKPEELLPLLKRVAREDKVANKHRYSQALQQVITNVSEADVEFILARCDKDGSGSVSFEELGPALATWKEASKDIEHKEGKPQSSACALL